MKLAIETDNLTKTYGNPKNLDSVKAVQGLTMEVPSGAVFGFLGPNGAGKTTTIYLLLGILKPTSGKGKLLGRPLGDPRGKGKLGFLPESVNLHLHHTGISLLNYYGELLNINPVRRKERIHEVLEQVGLKESGNKFITTYSKGMVQRLGIAQALLNEPDLLILDEPTANLDPIGRKEVKDLLINIREAGKTIFISSHILSDVESLCDRVCILKGGKIIRAGTMEELNTNKGVIEIRTKNLPEEAGQKITGL
ncbi:MAG TPA: ABC transporter ATP-binding protein, partial [Candidatus Eremiobacteraeota bacterium]|nr:ABC transporter ATP-binding protein [Candidatus Eremiobacteraeota bacterium]